MTMTQITIKVTDEEKEMLEKAGDILGMGHSTFMRSVSLERARDLVKKNSEK